MNILTHLPAEYFYRNIPEITTRTFFNRIASRGVWYIEQASGTRLYDVADWNKKNPDMQLDSSQFLDNVVKSDVKDAVDK